MKTPFNAQQFFSVFEKYNNTVFPMQIVILLVGLVAVLLLFSYYKYRQFVIGSLLGFLWIWMGGVYFLGFFTEISKAGLIVGFIFLFEGAYLIYAMIKTKLNLKFQSTINDYLALFFILFGLIIYPVIEILKGDESIRIISLGLPCPTTIFTIGFLMLSNEKTVRYLLIVPAIWSLIGISAAINFNITQDFVMILAAITAYINRWKENKVINKSCRQQMHG